MKPAILLCLVSALALVACSSEDPNGSVESALTESSPTDHAGGAGTFKVDTSKDPHACPYSGGCDGDVHPSSGSVSVNGRDCEIDAKAATLRMDPLGVDTQSLTWQLEIDAGACGILRLEGPHFEAYPAKGTASIDDRDATVTIEHGPTSHQPHAIEATAKVDDKAVTFRMFFGDEK